MFERNKVRFGITPTGWTNDDLPALGGEISFERTVSEIALAGFDGCSIGHKFPTNASDLKRELALRNLQVSEPWVGTFFTSSEMEARTVENFERASLFMKEMGGNTVVVAELGHAVHQQPVSALSNKPVFDERQWRAMVAGVERLGRRAAEEGMHLCYHPHIGTGVQTKAEIERLLVETDPQRVFLLLDTGHLYWAGVDPLDISEVYAARIKHVHLKDVRADVLARCTRHRFSFLESVVEGVFTVPGDGSIDFRPILQALSNKGYEGWLVVEAEQDPQMANPLEYAKKARAYLAELTGL